MTSTQLDDAAVEREVRRTLQAVAATVESTPTAALERRRRRRRRILIGLGALAVGIPLTAAAIVRIGPEYVDKLPPDNVIVTDEIDGSRYWMVESFHRDACGQPNPGVEIVVEERNFIGSEWSTTGYTYGEPRLRRGGYCGFDVSAALADSALSFSSGTQVGDSMVWVYAVHPDITGVRVTLDGISQDVAVYPLNGAAYAVVEIPEDTDSYSAELLIDGDVVPGSMHTMDMGR